MDGLDGSPGGRGYRAPYGANNVSMKTRLKKLRMKLQNRYVQIEQLRSLWDRNGDRLADNFRPIQPLNNRTVEYIEQWPDF